MYVFFPHQHTTYFRHNLLLFLITRFQTCSTCVLLQGSDCSCLGCPFLEIFLLHVTLTLSFHCGGKSAGRWRKGSAAAAATAEKAFPLIYKTSSRALPLPKNPSLPGASFKDRPLRNGPTRHADPCSHVTALVREAGGAGLDLNPGNCLALTFLRLCVRTCFCVSTWARRSVNHEFLPMTYWWHLGSHDGQI